MKGSPEPEGILRKHSQVKKVVTLVKHFNVYDALKSNKTLMKMNRSELE
jgi:hypothetical protein